MAQLGNPLAWAFGSQGFDWVVGQSRLVSGWCRFTSWGRTGCRNFIQLSSSAGTKSSLSASSPAATARKGQRMSCPWTRTMSCSISLSYRVQKWPQICPGSLIYRDTDNLSFREFFDSLDCRSNCETGLGYKSSNLWIWLFPLLLQEQLIGLCHRSDERFDFSYRSSLLRQDLGCRSSFSEMRGLFTAGAATSWLTGGPNNLFRCRSNYDLRIFVAHKTTGGGAQTPWVFYYIILHHFKY